MTRTVLEERGRSDRNDIADRGDGGEGRTLVAPEGLVKDLDLSAHMDGSWPSSKNVSQ